MHATINSLPDPNYATLRALTLVSGRLFNQRNLNALIHLALEPGAGTF